MEGARIVEIGGLKVIRVGAFIEATSLFHAVGYKRPRHLVSHLRCQRQPFPAVPHTHILPAVKVSREMWGLLASLGVPGFVAPARYHGASQTALLAPLGVTDLVATSPRNSAQRTDLQAFNRALWSAGQVEVEVEEGFDPCPEEETPNPPPPTADEEPQEAEAEPEPEPEMSDYHLDLTCRAMMVPGAPDGFPVCFDRLWDVCGYKRRDHATNKLRDVLDEGTDFCSQKPGSKPGSGGHNRVNFYLTSYGALEVAQVAPNKAMGRRVRRGLMKLAEEGARAQTAPPAQNSSDVAALLAGLTKTIEVIGVALAPLANQAATNAQDIHTLKVGADKAAVAAEDLAAVKLRQDAHEDLLRKRAESDRGKRLYPMVGADVAKAVGAYSVSSSPHGRLMRVCAWYLGIVARHVDAPEKGAWLQTFTMNVGGKHPFKDVDIMRYNDAGADSIREFLDLVFCGEVDPGLGVEVLDGGGRRITFPADVTDKKWKVWRSALKRETQTVH